jgi:hypothetical protein
LTGCLEPPHRQDEDLVPLTAGACSPRRRSSRRTLRQTSGPGSQPRDSRGAASRRHRARHPNLAQMPLRTADSLACWVKQRSPAYASAPSRHGRRRVRTKADSGGKRVYLAFEPLATPATAVSVSAPSKATLLRHVVGYASVGRRAASAGRSSADRAPEALRNREDHPEWLSWVVCGHGGWLSSIGPAGCWADVKGPSPRPFRHGGIPHGSTS